MTGNLLNRLAVAWSLVPGPWSLQFARRFVAAGLLWIAAATNAAELRIGLSADVTTFDPHFVAAQPNLTVAHHVFEPLMHVDERGRAIPVLATWRNPDPLTWEFTLRKGVKFHDGSELTTEDVAFSLERPLTIKGSPGSFATYVKPIVRKEIVSRHTIRLKTATPYGAIPQDLAEVMIVSKKAAQNATGGRLRQRKSGDRHRALQAGPLRARRTGSSSRATTSTGAGSCRGTR